MDIEFKGVFTDVFRSAKGSSWYTFVDLGNGGTVKLVAPGDFIGIKPGDMVHVKATIKLQPDKSGGAYLVYQDGKVEKS